MSFLVIDEVAKTFDHHQALKNVSLRIQQGEFFSLLGPSGCGKTTLLNIIAGFLSPTQGAVYLNNTEITGLPPYQRNIGMVFQNYALFPHLSVAENVAYGLKVRKVSRSLQKERVNEVLQQVKLSHLTDRMPHQLSGGQQQRVAIARALAIRPEILLMDEPLSNLDAQLRKDMQNELRRLQQEVGITTVLVTHDQEEALTLSDRIGVLENGYLQQVGSPTELYRHPVNQFVAGFIGQANILPIQSLTNDGYYLTAFKDDDDQSVKIPVSDITVKASAVVLRPERIQLLPVDVLDDTKNKIKATVHAVSYAGSTLHFSFVLHNAGLLYVHVPETQFEQLPAVGNQFYLSWDNRDVVVLSE